MQTKEKKNPLASYDITTIKDILNSGNKTKRGIITAGVPWVIPRQPGKEGIDYIGLLYDETDFLPFYADKTRKLILGVDEETNVQFSEKEIRAELLGLREKRYGLIPVFVIGTLSFGDNLYKNNYSLKINEFDGITTKLH